MDRIIGNAHTRPGDVLVLCPHNDDGIFAESISRISDASRAASIWMNGFLFGNEVEPPLDRDGFVFDNDSNEIRDWWRDIDEFHQTGTWPNPYGLWDWSTD
jgi:hypothetical protein